MTRMVTMTATTSKIRSTTTNVAKVAPRAVMVVWEVWVTGAVESNMPGLCCITAA